MLDTPFLHHGFKHAASLRRPARPRNAIVSQCLVGMSVDEGNICRHKTSCTCVRVLKSQSRMFQGRSSFLPAGHCQQVNDNLSTGFKANADVLPEQMPKGVLKLNAPCKAAGALLKYILKPENISPERRAAVEERYQELLSLVSGQGAVRVMHLSLPPSTAGNVHTVLKSSRSALEEADGVFLVDYPLQDLDEEVKLKRLLISSSKIQAFPGLQKLGPKSGWQPQNTKQDAVTLLFMLQHGMAVEQAIIELANIWGHSLEFQSHRACFAVALLENLPPRLHTLYEHELDVWANAVNTQQLKHPGLSLRVSSMPDLPRPLQDSGGSADRLLYDHSSPVDVRSCSSQSASAWALADDGIGKCIAAAHKDWGQVQLMEGISFHATIVSLPFTYTPAHIEDMSQGAVNDLLYGACKVWFVVSPSKNAIFKEILVEQHGPDAPQQLFEKQLRPILSSEQMQACGVRVIYQKPGQMMVTMPVSSA